MVLIWLVILALKVQRTSASDKSQFWALEDEDMRIIPNLALILILKVQITSMSLVSRFQALEDS